MNSVGKIYGLPRVHRARDRLLKREATRLQMDSPDWSPAVVNLGSEVPVPSSRGANQQGSGLGQTRETPDGRLKHSVMEQQRYVKLILLFEKSPYVEKIPLDAKI